MKTPKTVMVIVSKQIVGARSWTQWRDNIKSRYANPTEEYLDELFNNWN